MEKSIFIIDDDSVDREFFKIMFSLYGFTVEVADSVEQGLRLLKERRPDLILIDNHLPQTAGLDIVRTLKNDKEFAGVADVPVMLLSENTNPDNKVAGYEIGVEDYIIKPYNFLEILVRVRAVFRSQALTSEIIARERRLALVESLNSSLIYFSRHLRGPMLNLQTQANMLLEQLDTDSAKHPPAGETVLEFVKLVRKNVKETITALDGLEDEVNDLSSKGAEIKGDELTPDMLEMKYRKHFTQHHARVIEMERERTAKEGEEGNE